MSDCCDSIWRCTLLDEITGSSGAKDLDIAITAGVFRYSQIACHYGHGTDQFTIKQVLCYLVLCEHFQPGDRVEEVRA